MKNIKSRERERGFTLIELMVVISIIGLLSSIVLVALKDVREKSKATKFRAEVEQFIKALELYRVDNGGKYPGEPAPFFNYQVNHNSLGNIVPTDFVTDLPNKLSKYISKIPIPPTRNTWFLYRYSSNVKCNGDTKQSNYYLLISSSQPGFNDWPFYIINGSLSQDFRCFSLK